MRKLYSWIICLVICIGSNVSLEAQTLINYQQQKHFKSILSYIQMGNMQLMLETE